MTESTHNMIGVVLAARYVLEERLGDGGTGTVYRARHVRIGRELAIKVLHRRLSAKPKLVRRFEREAEIAARLRHPNVIGVIDQGDAEDGLHFLVMELAPGRCLADMLGEAPMPASRVIPLVRQLCDGLQHAHEAGLVHRDFKPDNVIVELDRDGIEVPRIVDFGIAILRDNDTGDHDRLTTQGIAMGTPHYMAPEQVRGEVLDHRADLFALGLVCYELMTGKLPFEGTGVEVAHANMSVATPAMGVRVPTGEFDPLLEELVQRMLSKDPSLRPQTAAEVRELLTLIEYDRATAAVRLGVVPDESHDDDVPVLIPELPAVVRPMGIMGIEPLTRPNPVLVRGTMLGVEPFKRPPSLEPTPMSAPPRVKVAIAADPPVSGIPAPATVPVEPPVFPATPARMGRLVLAVTLALATLLSLVAAALMGRPAPAPAAAPMAFPGVEAPGAGTREALAAREPAPPAARPHDVGPAPLASFAPSPTPVGPAAPAPPSAAEVASLYGAVGRELKELDVAQGQRATFDLWPRFRWIRIYDYLVSPERRQLAVALLEHIRSDIALRTRDRGSAGG